MREIETGEYDQPWNYGSFSVSTGFSNEGQFSGPVKTEMVDIVTLDKDPTLDGLSALHLLKIDAEGHELAVISGAKKLIARHQPNVFVEPGGKQNIDKLRDAMHKLGYHGYWFIGRRYGPNDDAPPHLNNSHHDINLVFRPKSAPPLNLPVLNSAADLDPGIPILVSYGLTPSQ